MDRARSPGYALALLSLLTVLNVMDRQLLAVLIDPIKRELGASDAEMGLLTGTSFAVLHVVATVPIARWADRGTRRTIIAVGLAIWSGLTLLTAQARTYGEIFALRVGVGIGEAAGGAPAQSLLADLFPRERRASAMAIHVMGGPLGSMLAFGLGGWLAQAFGWRTAFAIFGLPGILLALLIRFTLEEPERGRLDAGGAGREPGSLPPANPHAPLPFGAALRSVWSAVSIRRYVFASGLNSIGTYAILVWSAPYMTRVHDLAPSEAGVRLAIASGLFTALGTLAAGTLADRLARKDVRWLAWLPAITSAAIFPFGMAFVAADDGNVATLFLALASFCAGCYFGPLYGAVQSIARPQTRALAGSMVAMTNTILGLGLAPPLVGLLSDRFATTWGAESVRPALGALFVVHLGAGVLLWLASRSLRRDLGTASSDAGAAI